MEVKSGQEKGKNFDCMICSQTFRRQTSLNQHLKSVQENVKKFVCAIAAKLFPRNRRWSDTLKLCTKKKKNLNAVCVANPFACKKP